MKEKHTARFFYSPICPESFATLERLKEAFNDTKDIYFETFNLVDDNLESNLPWFPEEQKLIETYLGNGTKPLLYAKLFINGNEIGGFPPSKKLLNEMLMRYGIKLDLSNYTHNYGTFHPHDRIECDNNEFYFAMYNQNNLHDASMVCTKYHPYLCTDAYDIDIWSKFEKQKCTFIGNKLESGQMIGVIAYLKGRPVGLIEAFPLDESAKLGFPISELDRNALMITCLSVCTEFNGYGLARRLIIELEDKAMSLGYVSLEVLTFPDEHNWQPFSLYSKLKFIQSRILDSGLILVKKQLGK